VECINEALMHGSILYGTEANIYEMMTSEEVSCGDL